LRVVVAKECAIWAWTNEVLRNENRYTYLATCICSSAGSSTHEK
jgi:hypothetical protein